MKNSLCDAFQVRSRSAWRLISRGQSAGVRAAEETITNLTLMELSLPYRPGFRIRACSKKEEASLGADWEMWFGGRTGRWLGLRVQAKAIDLESVNFPHLHYRKKGASLYQSDTLIRNALASTPALTPVYVLYTYARGALLKTWPCGSYQKQTSLFGCSLVSAFQIRLLRLKGHKRALADLSDHMLPWHCLVCCNNYSNGSLAERAASYLSNTLIAGDTGESILGSPAAEGSLHEEELAQLFEVYRRPRLSERAPNYVLSLLSDREPELPDNLSAVLVVHEGDPA